MDQTRRNGCSVGVDGCRAGWIAVSIKSDGTAGIDLYSTIADLWKAQGETADRILLDMPIGLISGSESDLALYGPFQRACDVQARQRLKPTRASSIFPAPLREVLETSDYKEANALSRQLSTKGLSKQAWNLVPKIRQVDQLVRLTAGARDLVMESHPEVCLAAIFGSPMKHNKKTEEGYQERLAHLIELYPTAEMVIQQGMELFPRKAAARDDIVDALILAVAGWLSKGELAMVPEVMERDACGIPMRIVFYKPKEDRLLNIGIRNKHFYKI